MTTRSEAYETYKTDYQYHDAVEDVTVIRDGSTLVASAKAKMELPTESPLKSEGEGVMDTAFTCRWTVWDATLGGAVLRENDVLQRANGDRWRLKDTSRQLFDTQWHCNTQKDR